MKFKRAVMLEPYKMGFVEVDEEPNPGEVMIRVEGCGLCNWELNHWRGTLADLKYPAKVGHEFSGVIVKLGEGCKKYAVGDRVSCLGNGAFAEYAFSAETSCVKLEDHVDVRFAMGEPQMCIVNVLDAAHPKVGDYGVIQGCGPMGLWCIMALAGNYLGALIAVDIDDSKLALAKKFGATHIINSKKEDPVAAIREITKGSMADFAIEGTGVPALLDKAQEFVKVGQRGRLILMSSHHSETTFDFRKACDRGLTVIGAHPKYAYIPLDNHRRAGLLTNNGTFKNEQIVSHVFSLDEIQLAFETLDKKPADYIKGVVVPHK